MLINKTNMDIWYNEYKDQYKRTTKYIKSKGGTPRGLAMLSRTEFEMDFKSEALDNPKKSGVQIAKSMAKEELFPKSFKQAQKYAEAHVREFGGTVNAHLIAQYRLETNKAIFPEIESRRSELFTKGKSKAEVALIISQEFYGS